MEAAATVFLGDDATGLVFAGAALVAVVTGLRALLDLGAGAAFGVFDGAEELDLACGLAAVLATVLTVVLAVTLAVFLAGATDLAATLGAATALTFALTAVTLAVAFLVEVFTSCLLAV